MTESKNKLYKILEKASKTKLLELKKVANLFYKSSSISKNKFNEANEVIDELILLRENGVMINDNNIIISFKVLNERGVYDDYTLNWSIGCWDKPEYNYSINDAYFKVFDSTDIKKARKCARITILNPRYIIHTGKKADNSKKPWTLTSIELKELDRIMRLKFRGESVWQ